MELKWGHLCLQAVPAGPLLTVIGYANKVNLPPAPEHRLRLELDLALMLHAHQNEGKNDEPMIVEISDDQGTVVETLGPVPVRWHSVHAGLPLRAPAAITSGGWYLPKPGVHHVAISIGGVPVEGHTDFYVLPTGVAPGTPPPAPPGLRKHGVKLEWGHLADGWMPHPVNPALYCFQNVRDFVDLPVGAPRDRDRWLIVMASFGSHDSSEHRWNLELADADENVLETWPEAAFNGVRPGPGHLSMAFGFAELEGVSAYEDTGEYVYHVLVDGKRVGQVPFSVLRV